MEQRQAMRPQQNNFIQTKLIRSNQGFTIVEILIALVLIVLVLSIAMSNPFSSNDELLKQSDDIERGLRFMSDESALRNSVVRMHFMLNNAPQEYAIEYGPSDSFILPPEPEFETTSISKEEEEKLNKLNKNTNMKFNKVQEFQDSNTEVSDNVKIIGIGNGSSKKFKSTGEASIYSFASGEKDDALVILANDESVISLKVMPFTNKIERNIFKLETSGNRELIDLQNEKAKEIFEQWLKDKK